MEHRELLQIFGARIRELRHAHGWTQGDVAHKARVTRDFLGRAERGDREPSLYVLLKLATVFNVSPAYLLTPSVAEGGAILDELVKFLSPHSPQELIWIKELVQFHMKHSAPGQPLAQVAEPVLPTKYGGPDRKRRRRRTGL